MNIALAVNAILFISIIGFELTKFIKCCYRKVKWFPGFLTVTNLVFLITFCLPPLMIYGYRKEYFHFDIEQVSFFTYRMMLSDSFSVEAEQKAIWAGMLGYFSLLHGYLLTNKVLSESFKLKDLSPARTLSIASFLLVLSCIAAFTYCFTWQGEQGLVEASRDLRSGVAVHRYGFLKHFIQLALPGFFFVCSLLFFAQGKIRWAVYLALSCSLMLAALVYWHNEGRIELFTFIVTLPLAYFLSPKRNNLFVMIGIGLLPVIMLFVLGDSLASGDYREYVDGVGYLVLRGFAELSFPHPVLTSAITNVPEVVEYGYFTDFLVSLMYLLPSLGSEGGLPLTTAMISRQYLPTSEPLPLDLMSFGFFSYGWIGLIGICALFGSFLSIVNKVLSNSESCLILCFRSAWLLYLPLRLMYGDTYSSTKWGFALFVGTLLLVAGSWQGRKKLV